MCVGLDGWLDGWIEELINEVTEEQPNSRDKAFHSCGLPWKHSCLSFSVPGTLVSCQVSCAPPPSSPLSTRLSLVFLSLTHFSLFARPFLLCFSSRLDTINLFHLPSLSLPHLLRLLSPAFLRFISPSVYLLLYSPQNAADTGSLSLTALLLSE